MAAKKPKKVKCPKCGRIIKFEDLEEVKDTRGKVNLN
jgi:endogenous inhibitor of DNA gyrase (YacG/DUF329 family)